jgi:hypothetical protein
VGAFEEIYFISYFWKLDPVSTVNVHFTFLYIFLAGYSVLATPLLMSPILCFLRDIWIRTLRPAWQAEALPT